MSTNSNPSSPSFFDKIAESNPMPSTEATMPPSSSFTSEAATTSESWFSEKNILIFVLLGLLVLSFIGVNLLSVSGNILDSLSEIFGPMFRNVASIFGYSTGELINTTADVASDTAKLGIDIAEGTLQNVGNLLKDASKGGMDETRRKSLEQSLRGSNCPTDRTAMAAEPDAASNNIQNSISAQKGNWCLTGEYQGTRGCVAMTEHSKCMSGQIFPNQNVCLQK
jgi:hypothetical protein